MNDFSSESLEPGSAEARGAFPKVPTALACVCGARSDFPRLIPPPRRIFISNEQTLGGELLLIYGVESFINHAAASAQPPEN